MDWLARVAGAGADPGLQANAGAVRREERCPPVVQPKPARGAGTWDEVVLLCDIAGGDHHRRDEARVVEVVFF